MSDAEKAYQATPASTLEEQIMNPCIAKNEREWWAAAEIERLRAALREYLDADDHLAKVMPERVAEGVIEAAIKRVRAAKREARAVLAQEKQG